MLRRTQENRPDRENSFAVLNGQEEVAKTWKRTLISEPLDRLVILSDGAWAPTEMWQQNPRLAEEFFGILEKGGLKSTLKWARDLQNRGSAKEWLKRPEATAVSINYKQR